MHRGYELQMMDGETNCPTLVANVRSVVVRAFQAKAGKGSHGDCSDEEPDMELKATVQRGLEQVLGNDKKLNIYTGLLQGDPMISVLIADNAPITFLAGEKNAESLKEAAAMEVASFFSSFWPGFLPFFNFFFGQVASCLHNPSHLSRLHLPGLLHPHVRQFL